MRKYSYPIYFLFIGLIPYCTTPKTYNWGQKKVTKKKFDRNLKRFTLKYVKENPPDFLLEQVPYSITIDTIK